MAGNGVSRLSLVMALLGSLANGTVAAQNPLEPPGERILGEARALVDGMIANPRGPYSRIRWFCNDGTVQPPVPYACTERGGGRQHGEFSAQRQRLAELGYSVGTVFAALAWEELWDADRRHQRLRELALERYLVDVADGWVLHKARTYRGRVQIEAEEAAGRGLLLRLLSDPAWVADNYLLARESVRVIPHAGGAEDRTREIRRTAVDLAESDKTFEPLRIEIHTTPSAATAARVRAWGFGRRGAAAELAAELAAQLEALFGIPGRRARLAAQQRLLDGQLTTAALARSLGAVIDESRPSFERVVALAALLKDIRTTIGAQGQAATRLLLFDVLNEVEAELVLSANQALQSETLSRAELLALATSLAQATFGSGLLTAGEHARLMTHWQTVTARPALSLQRYGEAIAYLRRMPQWAVGSVRHAFAEPLIRYAALDRRAATFPDDLLRSSPLLPLAEVTMRLNRDLAELSGVTQNVFGETGGSAFGLNPGLALGPLVLVDDADTEAKHTYQRSDIVVVPETEAELAPVAGILTLGEGNPLSHVQLLARNFGIPNVAIAPSLLAHVRPLAGQQVLAAVASDGSVVLARASEVSEEIKAQLLPANPPSGQLTVPAPDLALQRPLALSELNASLSGRWVGPKAANLGELARLFPGRVAPAVAVPFGVFAAHMQTGTPTLRARLVQAYQQNRQGELSEADLSTALAAIRKDIQALELQAPYREILLGQMRESFGPPGSYGLFVRSDTNVEDLPQFTGAGLSETLPNVVDPHLQLAGIARVWASILSPRAIAWRSNLLTNPTEVYASVLLMKSVPSDKSGVLVTANLAGNSPALTVSTAWGVGGAVAGEAAETILLKADGDELLVSEAKVAYQRNLSAAGGLVWRAAPDGAVLTRADKLSLRALARQVAEKYTPALDEDGRPRPWDIEFGFVKGELTLFQIRPLVERGPRLADRVVDALIQRRPPPAPDLLIALDARPLTESPP